MVLKVFPEGTSVAEHGITAEDADNEKLVRAMEQVIIKRQIEVAKKQRQKL